MALPRFYSFLDTGKIPSTSQLNEFQYMDFLDALLQKGDALRIAFGSGMTPSGKNAQRAGAAVQGTECIRKNCLRRRKAENADCFPVHLQRRASPHSGTAAGAVPAPIS